ncbi:DNA-3-methyladenine glycosylase [Paenibacillus sp. J2TS4]|uniref:DNA-3-methyladenine glycosylase family protein n=1 Tax=Paenibacillus sp. J2TS4 TaxID=2807194 RepID=UPI001B136C87|nr:DNA-3-methyladenine glycosylase [Paenibacillus sp. J2TS4]GIP36456.1 DNA-3-methyladenine glycosylase II [Paenibacillus sp. J2TS4]
MKREEESGRTEAAATPAQRQIQLVVPQPFSFTETLGYLSRSPNECMFRIDNGKLYSHIPVTDERSGPVIEISGEQDGSLVITFLEENVPSKSSRDAIARYVHEWFDLDTDLAPFYEMAADDALLNKVIRRFYGLRLVGIPDLFEALCWGIIGQQINLTFAYTLKRRFVESFGQHVERNGVKYWSFPSPAAIADLSVDDLTQLQLTAKKSEYLLGVAQLMAEGKLAKKQLLEAESCQAAEQQLIAIRGIGPWTANYVLMRCLRFPSAFPIADVGLHNAIRHLMGLDNKPSLEEIRRLGSTWAGWESYATFYLWRSIY